MTDIIFHVKKRDLAQKPKHIRKQGFVPANVYGGVESVALQIDKKVLFREMKNAGDAPLVYLSIDGQKKKIPVLIDEVEYTALSSEPIHVTFRQVDLKEAVTTEVSIEFVGEIDITDAMMVVVKDFVEVSALPTDLPDKFELDVSGLESIGDTLTTADLKYDESIMTLVEVEDEPITLVVVQDATQPEEEVEEPESDGEGEDGASEEVTTEESGGDQGGDDQSSD